MHVVRDDIIRASEAKPLLSGRGETGYLVRCVCAIVYQIWYLRPINCTIVFGTLRLRNSLPYYGTYVALIAQKKC